MSDNFQLKYNKAKTGKGFLVDEDDRGVLPVLNVSKSMSKDEADEFIKSLYTKKEQS